MEIAPFHDYSDALVPLPALPLNPSESGSAADRTDAVPFHDELASRMGPDVTTDSPQIFDPGAGSLPIQTSAPPPLPTSSIVEPSAQDPEEARELMQICRQLEGLLLGILLRNLSDTIPGGGLFSKSWESSIYQDLFFQEIANSIGSQPPGLGIADMVYDDIISRASGTLDVVA